MKKLIQLILLIPLLLLLGCKTFPFVPVTQPGTTNVTYVVSPALTNALGIAGQVNQLAPPGPWTPIISIGLGAIATALAVWTQNKNKSLQSALAAHIDSTTPKS